MAKKEKTLRDIGLHDLLRDLSASISAVHLYGEPGTVEKLLKDDEFRAKYNKSRDDMKAQISEVLKRFNAPSNYDQL